MAGRRIRWWVAEMLGVARVCAELAQESAEQLMADGSRLREKV